MATEFVILETAQDVKDFREAAEQHFKSSVLAEKYLDGLIGWDGAEICDYCYGPCECGALDSWPIF